MSMLRSKCPLLSQDSDADEALLLLVGEGEDVDEAGQAGLGGLETAHGIEEQVRLVRPGPVDRHSDVHGRFLS